MKIGEAHPERFLVKTSFFFAKNDRDAKVDAKVKDMDFLSYLGELRREVGHFSCRCADDDFFIAGHRYDSPISITNPRAIKTIFFCTLFTQKAYARKKTRHGDA